MTQRQSETHQKAKQNKKEKPVFFPVMGGPISFAMPTDHNWALRKQMASARGSNKNRPGGPREFWKKPAPPEPLPEAVQEFVDKHIKGVLETTEEGREFLKEYPDGPPSRV